MSARKRRVASLGVLAAVYWIGVLGYMLIQPEVTFETAMYMMVITLATVGALQDREGS